MLQDVLSMYRGASQALADMEQLITKYESDEVVRHWLEQARFKVRKVARLNYYEIIGVGTVASELEIKSAYKLRALECHPDKWATGTDEEKSHAEAEFKKLGEALEVLGEAMKRQLYDEGFDREAIEERVSRANKAARESDHRHHR